MIPQLTRFVTRNQLSKDSLVAVFAQFSNAAFSLVTAVLFARMLGATEFGAYTVATAWASLLAVLGRIGLDSYTTRELAIALNRKDWPRSMGMLLSVLILVIAVSSALALILYAGFLWIDPDIDQALKRLFGYSCLLVPVLSLEIIVHSILRAAGHNSVAVLIRFFIRPLLLILVLSIAYALEIRFTGLEAILSQTGTVMFGSCLLIIAAIVSLPKELLGSRPVFNARVHGKGGLRFLAIAGLGVVIANTDIVMLGFISTAQEAGMYRVASRVAVVITLSLAAVSLPLAPRLAVLYQEHRPQQLKKIYHKANALSLALSLPLFLIFIIFSGELLSIFGSEFAAASPLLVALAMVAMIDVFMGPAALCLNMVGRENTVTIILAAASLLNVLLNLFLIPKYGAMGAVFATAITVTAWKLAAWYRLYNEFRILPGGLGLFIGQNEGEPRKSC